MSLYWGPMASSITRAVSAVRAGLSAVQGAQSGMVLKKIAKLQWDMAIMQQVLQASSNVTEGALSCTKNAIGNMNR